MNRENPLNVFYFPTSVLQARRYWRRIVRRDHHGLACQMRNHREKRAKRDRAFLRDLIPDTDRRLPFQG